ncbi:hypothetical protein AWB72_01830 [Caballeronia concitans]|uniref:Lipoprotein n=1 Tax=Caballeronia concitans TaxID=1777133 RepID=A0A658QUY5_9BURK|nr:hypothetical protein BurMR1_2171 [Burkholderia sp. MR1]SAL24138.1 hypothetical protein AWB72_01830 [Caballeronia concitans]
MKALFLAVTGGVLLSLGSIAYAQSTGSDSSSSMGGSRSGAYDSGQSGQCVTGLSCNIYRGS